MTASVITSIWAEAFVRSPHRWPRLTRFLYRRYLTSRRPAR